MTCWCKVTQLSPSTALSPHPWLLHGGLCFSKEPVGVSVQPLGPQQGRNSKQLAWGRVRPHSDASRRSAGVIMSMSAPRTHELHRPRASVCFSALRPQ